MGGLISRRRRAKVEAKKVSAQAAKECSAASQPTTECPLEATTDTYGETPKPAAELNIGDGLLPSHPDLQQHDSSSPIVTRRESSENKKRRGLSKMKTRVRSGEPENSQDADLSTQYDYHGLPGQVLPSYGSPLCENRTELTDCPRRGFKPELLGNPSLDRTLDLNACPRQLPVFSTSIVNDNKVDGETSTMRKQSPRRTEVTPTNFNHDVEEDENSNIVKEGTLLAELRNRDIYGACTEDELNTLLSGSGELPLSWERSYNAASAKELLVVTEDHTPRRQSKKTVTYSEDCKKAVVDFPSRHFSQPPRPEFRLSLEEIFQKNVPCHADVLEVAAVTGTSRGCQTTVSMMREDYNAIRSAFTVFARGAESSHHEETKRLMSIASLPATRGSETNTCFTPQNQVKAAAVTGELQREEMIVSEEVEGDACRGEDIAEDTLDWNVDDRVRSPLDSRAESINGSKDNDDNNVDLLTDCAIVTLPTSANQRQNSLTTIKDGGSAGISLNSPSHSQTPTARELQTHDERSPITETEVNQQRDKQTLRTRYDCISAKPPLPKKEATRKPSTGSVHNFTEGVIQNEALANNGKNVPEQKDKLIKQINKQTISECEQQKSLLEIQEAEAMTLLLLTGTLPGEEGVGVTRGAGDAQTMDTANGANKEDNDREAEERAGIESMLDPLSKSTCQLEQLQVDQLHTDNLQHITPTLKTISSAGPQTRERPQGKSILKTINSEEKTDRSAFSSVPQDNEQNVNYDAAAASCVEESEENTVLSPKRTSPGAASSEGDWEIIPVHRVPAHTNLGASAASALYASLEVDDEYQQSSAMGSDRSLDEQEVQTNSSAEGQAAAEMQVWPVEDDQIHWQNQLE